MVEQSTLEQLAQDITRLSKRLPTSIPEATKDDRIYATMTKVKGDLPWETFNRRFDILFGEDCRNKEGRLFYICRGRHGMNIVTAYLSRVVNEDHLKGSYDIAAIKLERLRDELWVLTGTM